MRMWMINPAILCRKHLLGEHGEIHKHKHNFEKGHSIEGRKGQIEPLAMQSRHDELVEEMTKRGFNHKSPYEMPDLSIYNLDEFVVDKNKSMNDLMLRCEDCRNRKQKYYGND